MSGQIEGFEEHLSRLTKPQQYLEVRLTLDTIHLFGLLGRGVGEGVGVVLLAESGLVVVVTLQLQSPLSVSQLQLLVRETLSLEPRDGHNSHHHAEDDGAKAEHGELCGSVAPVLGAVGGSRVGLGGRGGGADPIDTESPAGHDG